MPELTLGQAAAIEYARREILARYENQKAPPTEHLERIANELIQTFTARVRAQGEAIEDVRVHVKHVGGGRYEVTPVVAEPIHSITITGSV